VPFHVQSGVAFLKTAQLCGQASDIVRVYHDDPHLAVMANAIDGPFSTCWPAGSRLMLDLFVVAWTTSTGRVKDRLFAAFERSRERFVARACSLLSFEPDYIGDHPAATLLAAVIEGTEVHVAGIGRDVALVARGSGVLAASVPHTLAERVRREDPDARDLSKIPNIIARVIAAWSDQAPPDYLAAPAKADDVLFLITRAPFRDPCVDVTDAAFAAGLSFSSPAVLAEVLVDAALTNSLCPYAAVAAVRLGS
jgi:hypothetical protein